MSAVSWWQRVKKPLAVDGKLCPSCSTPLVLFSDGIEVEGLGALQAPHYRCPLCSLVLLSHAQAKTALEALLALEDP